MADEEDEDLSVLDRGGATFNLARVAHGERNIMDDVYEIELQAKAKERREILLPGVDAATAYVFAACGQRTEAIFDKDDRGAGMHMRLERGFAVFFHESWPELHHLVRYFDLIEKNEAPDTSLLEWMIVARAVKLEAVKKMIARFEKALVPLDPHDVENVKISMQVAEEINAKEGVKP